MKTLTKNACFALIAATLLSACSRPYATFQKTTPDRFYAKKADVVSPVETTVVAPTAATPVVAEAVPAAEAPATLAAAQTQLNEMLVSTKAKVATDKKLTKRINRVQTLLATAAQKQTLQPTATTAKTSLMAKLVTKKIDKQIQKKLAPKAAQTQSAIRLGIILGVIGLILLIIGGGFFGTLGAIALAVGLVGILLGFLDIL